MAEKETSQSLVRLVSYKKTNHEGEESVLGQMVDQVTANGAIPDQIRATTDQVGQGILQEQATSLSEEVEASVILNPSTEDSPIDVPQEYVNGDIGNNAAQSKTTDFPANSTTMVMLHNSHEPVPVETTNGLENGINNSIGEASELEIISAQKGVERKKQDNIICNMMNPGTELLKEDIRLSWENVDVFVQRDRSDVAGEKKSGCLPCCRCCCKRTEAQTKQILFDNSGVVEPGTLLAIMGASGAGKSTLMNVLAYRNVGNMKIAGEVKVNGQDIGSQMATLSAYVQQQDLFIGTLTVREHLNFYALLRMGQGTTTEERKERVEQVMLDLGLTKCADTIIGIPGRIKGISGGEQKRLSFASEILTDPHLLFADEPTSGLDSFMAMNVVATLQKLASQGRTVMCTIHQPSSEVYAMFNSILLLANGRVAYVGPTEQAVDRFRELGYPCPTNYNPADYFVYTLAIIPGQEEESKERIKMICDTFEERTYHNKNGHDKVHRQDSFREEVLPAHQSYKVSWFTQFRAVLKRSFQANSRDNLVSRIKIIQAVVVAIIAGLIYFQIDNDQDSIQNISGALFFLVTTTSFSSLQSVLFVFPVELPVFLREHKNGMYRTDVYFLSKTLAELPIAILSTFLQVTIAYWMMGLRYDVSAFFICFGILQLVQFTAVSYGYCISTLAPTVTAATSLGPPLMLPLMLFGGFFLKDRTIPVYFIWLKYISWFKYGFEAVSINQWTDFGDLACTSAGSSSAPANVNMTSPVPCFRNGQSVLDFLGFDTEDIMFNVLMLVALIFLFRTISFLMLLRRSSMKH